MRDRVWRFLQRYPGTQVADVAAGLDLAHSHVEYHLRRLERQGMVRRDAEKACFAQQGDAVVDRRDRRLLARLRRTTPLRIVLALLDGPMSHGELVAAVGVAPSTLTYQAGRLEDVGAVVAEREGRTVRYVLSDPDHMVRLLTTYPPKPGTAEGLVAMLDALAER